jgi:hypothetical protein
MNEPLKNGDRCEVVGGMARKASPNLGLKVTVKHRVFGAHGMDHREFGAMYRCEGAGVCQMNDMGEFIVKGWADFPGIWLKKLPPETSPAKTVERFTTA